MTIKALYRVGGSQVIGIPETMRRRLVWHQGDDIFYIVVKKAVCYASNDLERLKKEVYRGGEVKERRVYKRKIIKNGAVTAAIFPGNMLAGMELVTKKYVELTVLADHVLRIQTML